MISVRCTKCWCVCVLRFLFMAQLLIGYLRPCNDGNLWLPACTVSFIPLLSLTCLTGITRVRRYVALTSVYKEAPWPNFISPIFFLTRGRPRPKARRRAGSTWGCARFLRVWRIRRLSSCVAIGKDKTFDSQEGNLAKIIDQIYSFNWF